MKKILTSWVAAMLLMYGASAQGHEERLATVDILHYDFTLYIHDTTDQVQGNAMIQMELKKATDQVVLDLVGQQGGKGMKVTFLSEAEERAIEYAQVGDELILKFGQLLPAGTKLEVGIGYAGIPADGLIISKNERDGRSFFGDNWPNRAHHWLPCVDHPSDKASVEFTIFAPAHYEIVANGTLQEQIVQQDGYQKSHWVNDEVLPTKVMVFGAADFAMESVGDAEGVPVSTWVFEKDEKAGFSDYQQGVEILRWFIAQIGDYPWDKLANVQSRTRYGGMENASCIFYADNSVKGDGSCEGLMAHEIAHQWFGNSASEAEWHHVWLSEGFATYLTHVYFEQKAGLEQLRQRMRGDRATILGWEPAQHWAVVEPSITDLNQLLSPNSYEKGSWVLHMLRHKIGDEAFFRGLREYYARFQFSNALTSDFQHVMEEMSGQDLNRFFEQWIHRPGFPKVQIVWSWKKGKQELTLNIAQTQAEDAFAFPLEVAALDEEGNVIANETIEINSKSQKAVIKVKSAPAKVVLDPQVKLLFSGKATKK